MATSEKVCRRCGEKHWQEVTRPFVLADSACPRYGYHAFELPNPTPEEMARVGLEAGMWMWGPTMYDQPDGSKVLRFGYDSGD